MGRVTKKVLNRARGLRCVDCALDRVSDPLHGYLETVISLYQKLPSGASTGAKPQWFLSIIRN